ncbi:MAG: hypothetical protein QE164_05435 [Candidatus Nezhaarchaeota archaeon]|nr:hypothetical protein [Candidatus Nezhaarchaeota archaeon]
MRRKGYPHTSDVMRAIMKVLASGKYVRLEDFYDEVRAELESEGFRTSYLTVKRVWRVYEEMVKKGFMYDVFNVVGYSDYNEEES